VLKGIKVLWIGHSTTLIQTPHLSVLTAEELQQAFNDLRNGTFTKSGGR